jgi:hypothetical protein
MTRDEIIEAEFEEVAPGRPNESRAIVAVARPPTQPRTSGIPFTFRADAAFVAQLIAADANAPQTRTLRRASPEDALASYRGTTTRERSTAPLTGKATSRVA